MKPETILSMGVDAFTLSDLYKKAAILKGLELRDFTSRAYSEPIKVYPLNDKLLAALAERGIKREARPDCRNEIFTLVDENHQEKIPGYEPSNYWNFKPLRAQGDKLKFNLKISLCVRFKVDTEKRGIVLYPQASGTFVSAADNLPNFRMFKALVGRDEAAPAIAKELAASDGSIVVTWTDLGLGGIHKLTSLFAEFAGNNETIKQLSIFDPAPSDDLFIAEPAQPRIVQTWRRQLKEYRAHLVA